MKEVIFHRYVSDALQAISNRDAFVSWQDMFFDRSTGTIDHQDTWYLDTEPAGSLVAAWFALEDLDPECGPFFVYPQSHLLPRLAKDNYENHDDFRLACLEAIEAHHLEKSHAILKKGDVLFWHPFTMHGAETPKSELYSRKSFTSHFYPKGERITGFGDDQVVIPTQNAKIEQLASQSFHPRKFQTNLYKTFLRQLLRGNWSPQMDMRRSSYS